MKTIVDFTQDCHCESCDRAQVTPLPPEKWNAGQRVKWCYHAPDMSQPAYATGVIVPRPADWVQYAPSDGFLVWRDGFPLDYDNPKAVVWFWDFMATGGIGNNSPVMGGNKV